MINNQSPFEHVGYVSVIKKYIRSIKIFILTPIVILSCTWLLGAMRFSPYDYFVCVDDRPKRFTQK